MLIELSSHKSFRGTHLTRLEEDQSEGVLTMSSYNYRYKRISNYIKL
uniref:Uncharacterized protein n=1 Tax=Utricularia reniformis TaxID=192314 RepID=A0A1Y0AZY8_9LAMI|nr:hypothetical protein AEK19_MT0428 [Utricularia reniformis]ART30691.1 hypothetical protein AEK19_MT0428 [Utricularia reniformis]